MREYIPPFPCLSSHLLTPCLRAQGSLPHLIWATRLSLVYQHGGGLCLWSQHSLSKGVNKQDVSCNLWKIISPCTGSMPFPYEITIMLSVPSPFFFLKSMRLILSPDHSPLSKCDWNVGEEKDTRDQIASKPMQWSGKDLRDVFVGQWEF